MNTFWGKLKHSVTQLLRHDDSLHTPSVWMSQEIEFKSLNTLNKHSLQADTKTYTYSPSIALKPLENIRPVFVLDDLEDLANQLTHELLVQSTRTANIDYRYILLGWQMTPEFSSSLSDDLKKHTSQFLALCAAHDSFTQLKTLIEHIIYHNYCLHLKPSE